MTDAEIAAKKLEDDAAAKKLQDDKDAAQKLIDDKAKADYDKLSAEEKLAADIKKGVEEALKPIKANLDKVYEERDIAITGLQKFQDAEKAQKLKDLEAAGKHKEVFDLQMKEKDDENATLKATNLKLTRDASLKAELGLLDFRNVSASSMAYREIVADLVQNEEKAWVHKSGVSIADFVATYAKNEDHAFLFKANISSGGGGKKIVKGKGGDGDNSLFSKSQAEVLKMAKEGKLPNQQN